MTYSHFI